MITDISSNVSSKSQKHGHKSDPRKIKILEIQSGTIFLQLKMKTEAQRG